MENPNITALSFYEIETLSQMLFDIFKASIHLIDSKRQVLFSLSHELLQHPLYSDFTEISDMLIDPLWLSALPIIKTTALLETYIINKITLPLEGTCFLIVGPTLPQNITPNDIDQVLMPYTTQLVIKRKIKNYLNTLPMIDTNKLYRIGQLIHYMFQHQLVDLLTLTNLSHSFQSEKKQPFLTFEQLQQQNKLNHTYHHSLKNEKMIISCVKEGNIQGIKKTFDYPHDGEFGVLSSTSVLRNEKNLAICGVTIATRAAISGGLNTEIALTLSDSYILEIEGITKIQELFNLRSRMLLDFTTRVQLINQQKYSTPVRKTLDYIHTHIFDNLTISKLAQNVQLTPHYLGDQFKSEVGYSLSHCILITKIEEAKSLLTSSTYSLIEIASMLNFHDQSHFSKTFKKMTSYTPKQFRNLIIYG